MRLSFVEVAGFRGFKGKTRLDLPGGFAVLTGRNGAGKSTVFDAVEFALTGTINKYDVKGAKGGGLDDHIWWVGEGAAADPHVTIGFVGDDGKDLVVRRSRGEGLETKLDGLAESICSEPGSAWLQTLVRTMLIRDETIAALSLDLSEQARFTAVRDALGGLAGPDVGARTALLLKAAAASREFSEKRVEEIQAELGRTREALAEARSLEALQPDLAQAETVISSLAPDLGAASGVRAALLRGRVADMRQSITTLEDLLGRAEVLASWRSVVESDARVIELEAARSELAARQEAKELAEERLVSAQRLQAAELERDALAGAMVALLNNGEALGLHNGRCPLCGTEQEFGQYSAAIAAARVRLASTADGAVEAAASLEKARREVEQVAKLHADAAAMVHALEEERTRLSVDSQGLRVALEPFGLASWDSAADTIRQALFQRQEDTVNLERALFILEASGAHDRVVALEARVSQLGEELKAASAKLAGAERAANTARQIDNAAKEVPNQVLVEQFDAVMPLLKELYRRLRPHADWCETETDFGGRVRASLNLTVGNGHNPQFLFSSGQRRAAGLAFLLAVHLSRPWCRLRTLLLDDPIQHIDDYRALNLVEVLSAVRRTGRQVIVAVEDPTLADVLCRRLRSSILEPGRLFELSTTNDGSGGIANQEDVLPLSRGILKAASG